MSEILNTLHIRKETLDKYLCLPNNQYFINSFIDYVGFYFNGNLRELQKPQNISSSDNDNSQIFKDFLLDYTSSHYCMIYITYNSLIIPFARIETITIHDAKYTKVSIYGKGLKVIRDLPILLDDLISLLETFGLKDSLVYSRLDITADYSQIAFNIKCLLKSVNINIIRGEFGIETKYFGSRKSSIFIRYYNKLKELSDKGRLDLYPEYNNYKSVMRYEIQLKSKSIPNKVHYNYSNLEGLKSICLGQDAVKLYEKPNSRKSKQSIIRAKSLFLSFLNSLSSRYYLNDDLDDINFIYNNWLHEIETKKNI